MLSWRSIAVEKSVDPVAADAPPANAIAWRTRHVVVYGQDRRGRATGAETRSAARMPAASKPGTPLLRQIDRFARRLAVAILALGA